MRKIKTMIKCIVILLCISVIGSLILLGDDLAEGYSVYKQVTAETPIEEMVQSIKTNPTYIPIEQVTPYFTEAIVAVEDHRFYNHNGIDLIGLIRAMLSNIVSGEIEQGGSTLSQQLAKNMYFNHEQTLVRKIAELLVTLDLERMYQKDEILEMYMNIIYFGRNAYGIQEASNKFFDKQPQELNKEEAAYLAGLPQAPSIYSQDHLLATKRQQVVLEAMQK